MASDSLSLARWGRSWAVCLPEDGAVVIVLTNHVVEDIGLMAEPLVDTVGSA